MRLLAIWRRLFSTRHSTIMEAEVARLRAENRALLNSILGIAGVPPVLVAGDPTEPAVKVKRDVGTSAAQPVTMKNGVSTAARANVVAPTRRRSWHQVYRMLEIDAARKKESV